jgi:hypothetical protein
MQASGKGLINYGESKEEGRKLTGWPETCHGSSAGREAMFTEALRQPVDDERRGLARPVLSGSPIQTSAVEVTRIFGSFHYFWRSS